MNTYKTLKLLILKIVRLTSVITYQLLTLKTYPQNILLKVNVYNPQNFIFFK